MKVTTLFGHSSSGGVGSIASTTSSGGAPDKKNKSQNNNSGFVPIQSSPTPTGGIMPAAPPAVERASSEVLYSSITPR